MTGRRLADVAHEMDDVERRRETAANLLAVKRFDEARTHVLDALSVAPSDPALLTLLARIELGADDTDAALDAITRALAAGPDVNVHHVACTVHRQRSDFASALSEADRAATLRPDSETVHVDRALSLTGLAQEEDDVDARAELLADAERAATSATELDPQSTGPHYAAALVDLTRDDLPEAAAHLTDAIERDPQWAPAHLLIAHVRARQGMTRLSSRHFAIAGSLDPLDDRSLTGLRRLATPRRWFRRGRVDTSGTDVRLSPEARRVLEAHERIGGAP